MGNLIAEINEILSHPFEGNVNEFIESKLTPESLQVFKFLPPSIS
jgi:pyrophosphate--fructose-6-phosphate 1-phosphotransferase